MTDFFIIEKTFAPLFEEFVRESFNQDFSFFTEPRKSGEVGRFMYGESLVSIIEMGLSYRIVSVDDKLLKTVVDMWGSFVYHRVSKELPEVPETKES